MNTDLSAKKRKSYIEMGEIFFWTATINNWQHLLLKDNYKNVIINSLTYLSDSGKIDVFGFVIMPNHIHLIWRINKMNGKETSQGSFLKYTAHEFKKILKTDMDKSLASYAVNAHNKGYEFWKRDSLAVNLFSKEIAYQKLDYTHYNPCTEYWQLAKEPCDYLFSSAKYYEMGVKNFTFLKDLREEF
ncbi:transposase [Ginsengibacter hankyongi]|nr:transposase [Ginsengibacter hankyongi]